MASVAVPTRAPHSEPTTATADAYPLEIQAIPARPPRSLSRPSPPKVNVDLQAVIKRSTPRSRGSGGLALQARDSVTVRKRAMSTGAVSARVARQNARKANAELLQPGSKRITRSPSPRTRSRSPGSPSTRTRTNSHINRTSRSSSPSSSSPSQSPTPITPGQLPLSGGPSSYQLRGRTHIPHDSQGTTTSAYPPSSPHSHRSSSSSSDRSRTPSPRGLRQKPSFQSVHNSPSLDLDPDDVNARLRLLVNNSYFLPPAHAKPELSPRPPPIDTRPSTSPSAFKEFFRVGRKKERRATEGSGYASEGARHSPRGRLLRVPSDDSPQSLSSGSDGRFGTPRHGDGYFGLATPEERSRNRVVVVRETVEELPPPLSRVPFRNASLHAHVRSATEPNSPYIDPTTQYDRPPPSHYPSYTNLGLDAAGIAGDVEVDQFAPPGEPWSPAPTSPLSAHGSAMDPQERVWRRAILEQAVDLSLSSAGSDRPLSPGPRDGSFGRGGRMNSGDSGEMAGMNGAPASPKSPKGKKSWWGRKEKEPDDTVRRPSTSSSLTGRDLSRSSGTERAYSLDADAQRPPSPRSKRNLGQRILPNVHAELEEFEREQARKEMEQKAGLPPPLRLRPSGLSSSSAPVTPVYQEELPGTPLLPLTPLRPPPPYRKGERRRDEMSVSDHFMPGHSTIRKSLSSPLLSDMHEMGIDVEESTPCNESVDGVAAPSLVLQDPQGVTSLMASQTVDSFTSGSHYSDDDQDMFDAGMRHGERQYHEDDNASLERWTPSIAGDGRPSFDSFGARRVHSPDEYPPRTSSTFGFRRSNVSVSTPSPLRGNPRDIEVDISGDPMEHLSVMESRRSPTPSIDSRISSTRGYTSALDYTVPVPATSRPQSPATTSFRSTQSRFGSPKSAPGRGESSGADTETAVPISFFDSIQHQAFMDQDSQSSDSEPEQAQSIPHATYSERPSHTQTLGRKSLSSARPTPAFTMQFRNASQPELPLSRGEALESRFRHIQPYDLLDRKRPLTNTPVAVPSTTSNGILSQLKGRPGKSSSGPFASTNKKRPGASVMLPESTFELLRYPHGSAFSLGSSSGAGVTTGSEVEYAEPGSGGLEAIRSQGSLLSLHSAEATSLGHVSSWRQEPGGQDESAKKLDGMVTQHLEAERDRLRKIASAARGRGAEPRH